MPELARGDATYRLSRVTLALFSIALIAGFAQFGAVASLNDVARHFGHLVDTRHSLRSAVGLSGSVLGLGLAVLRLASLGAMPLTATAERKIWAHVLSFKSHEALRHRQAG